MTELITKAWCTLTPTFVLSAPVGHPWITCGPLMARYPMERTAFEQGWVTSYLTENCRPSGHQPTAKRNIKQTRLPASFANVLLIFLVLQSQVYGCWSCLTCKAIIWADERASRAKRCVSSMILFVLQSEEYDWWTYMFVLQSAVCDWWTTLSRKAKIVTDELVSHAKHCVWLMIVIHVLQNGVHYRSTFFSSLAQRNVWLINLFPCKARCAMDELVCLAKRAVWLMTLSVLQSELCDWWPCLSSKASCVIDDLVCLAQRAVWLMTLSV